jgi:hypothetical protein
VFLHFFHDCFVKDYFLFTYFILINKGLFFTSFFVRFGLFSLYLSNAYINDEVNYSLIANNELERLWKLPWFKVLSQPAGTEENYEKPQDN